MKPLAQELDTYKKLLPSLLVDQGKFAVIYEDQLIGTFSSYEDALKIGYERCGVSKPFLVKKITEEEQIAFFSRDLSNICLV